MTYTEAAELLFIDSIGMPYFPSKSFNDVSGMSIDSWNFKFHIMKEIECWSDDVFCFKIF